MLKRKYEVKLEYLPRGEGMSEIQKIYYFREKHIPETCCLNPV